MNNRSQEAKESDPSLNENLNRAFIYSVMAGIKDNVFNCLELGADIEFKLPDTLSSPAICFAAALVENDILQLLLLRGAKVNAMNAKGSTALHAAAGAGNLPAMHLLMQHGAKLNQKNLAGLTPEDLAKQNGYNEAVKLLTVTIEQQYQLDMRLITSIRDGDAVTFNDCLSQKADIHFRTDHAGPALYEAAAVNNTAMIQQLLAVGADIESKSGCFPASANALYVAAGAGHLAAVECLINHNANVNAVNTLDKLTALQHAVSKGHKNVAAVLLGVPAINREQALGREKKTALHLSVITGNESMVELLLAKGCDPLALTLEYQSPLKLYFNSRVKRPNIAKLITRALAYHANEENLAVIIADFKRFGRLGLELLSHFIMMWLDFPEKFTSACKSVFLETILTTFEPDERDEIKNNLVSATRHISDSLDKRDICAKALDLAQNNPLSVMLNIKRRRIQTNCSSEKGKLAEFKKMHDEINAKYETQSPTPIYDEQTLQDLQRSVKEALVASNQITIDHCLEVLHGFNDVLPHPKISSMISALVEASARVVATPSAPPLYSNRGLPTLGSPVRDYGLFSGESSSSEIHRLANQPPSKTNNFYN